MSKWHSIRFEDENGESRDDIMAMVLGKGKTVDSVVETLFGKKYFVEIVGEKCLVYGRERGNLVATIKAEEV